MGASIESQAVETEAGISGMVQIVFECNGSDLASLPHETLRNEADLLKIAQALAVEKDVNLSEITLRFAADNHLSASAATPTTRPVITR